MSATCRARIIFDTKVWIRTVQALMVDAAMSFKACGWDGAVKISHMLLRFLKNALGIKQYDVCAKISRRMFSS
jgi:hypothetical protein